MRSALVYCLSLSSALAAGLPSDPTSSVGCNLACKCYEGESCWPSEHEWERLNTTVDGRLVKVIPPAAPCYNEFEGMPTYDQAACLEATDGFSSQPWMIESGIAPIRPFATNNTCLPTTNPEDTCTIGFLSEYVIMATETSHIVAGVNFAREHELRLLVRNTGHDFMGRSVAAGSLAINTHSLKDVNFTTSYLGPGGYTGSAVTLGAGVQGREIYTLASQQEPPVVIVGGECPTVGFSGGYIQGGGHGPLATYFGMAADQALSFEMITAEGKHVTANVDENPDLFWALKGGGPSTFGIVTSVTVKTFPEMKSAGTILNINSTHTNDTDLFWEAVGAFHSLANHYVDHGLFAYYELSELRLHVQPWVAPNMTARELDEVLAPLFAKLDDLGVSYDKTTKEFDTFFELYIDLFEDEPAGDHALFGGRFFNRDDIEEHSDLFIEAFKNATTIPGWDMSSIIYGHIVGPGVGNPNPDNAIHPGWRDASSFSITLVPLPLDASPSLQTDAWDVLTNVVDFGLREASPRGGAYVNEGNLEEPDWQNAYWGDNYPRLLGVKREWDPEGMFYARTTVGTEDWAEIGDPPKLCKRKAVVV